MVKFSLSLNKIQTGLQDWYPNESSYTGIGQNQLCPPSAKNPQFQQFLYRLYRKNSSKKTQFSWWSHIQSNLHFFDVPSQQNTSEEAPFTWFCTTVKKTPTFLSPKRFGTSAMSNSSCRHNLNNLASKIPNDQSGLYWSHWEEGENIDTGPVRNSMCGKVWIPGLAWTRAGIQKKY